MTETERILLALALDPDGLAPLGDYLQTLQDEGRAWTNERVPWLIYKRVETPWLLDDYPVELGSWFAANAAQPTPTFARACAAVLLFRDWSSQPWQIGAHRGRFRAAVRVGPNDTIVDIDVLNPDA